MHEKTNDEAAPKKTKTQAFKIGKGVLRFLEIIFVSLSTAVFSLVILGIIFGYGTYVSYSKSFEKAKPKSNSTQVVFYDKTGEVIYESFGAKKPDYVKLSDVPIVVRDATIAAEDANFYKHGAIDIRGIGRAMIGNIRASKKSGPAKVTDLFSEENYTQGGSTITQQLVKNIYLTNEKSFDRKLKEIVYSFELEKKYSKDQILESYLNNVYYGEQSLGIKNAAKNYFGKDISALTLGEASMLAGLPQAPTKFSPISGDFYESKTRQEYVLSKMVLLQMTDIEKAKEAANEPLDLESKKEASILKYPYFVEFVKDELKSFIGEEAVDRGGIEVHTTLDPKNQQAAENTAAEYIGKKFKSRKVTNAAVVVLDNKGQSLSAMVGGVNWEESNVNVADSKRQPGSSFKPIVYATGLLNGYTAVTRLLDTRVNFGGSPPYIPKNYDGGYRGNVTVRNALANSLNIPAVEMTKLVGVEKVIDTARKLGITTIDGDAGTYGLTIGLGSAEVKLFELTRAFSVFGNGGNYSVFSGIAKITDNEGSVIYEKKQSTESAIDKRVAYIMTSILSDNKARSLVFGSNSPLYFKDRPVAAKTGTTDDYNDSWTVGFTPQYTVGVWMGNNDRSKMARVSGVEGAAYIWHDVMAAIHEGLPAEEFTRPEGLTEAWVNPSTSAAARSHYRPNILEYFLPGTEPTNKPNFDYLNVFRASKKSISN